MEMLCVDTYLLAVKAEKLRDFHYLTRSDRQKKLSDKKQKEMTQLQKWSKTLASSFGEVLFVYKFICRVTA